MTPLPDEDRADPLPAETVTRETVPLPHGLPDRIGRYHIKRVIASGGMGTVYEATQDNPRRVVAVKVMKQGIASKSALRRFEYEGQILGRLRHPGIAQIYEAGTHVIEPRAEYEPRARSERITNRADQGSNDPNRDRNVAPPLVGGADTNCDPGAPGQMVPFSVPYFAMEYIPNAKLITVYADEKKLGTRQRMELFAKVCDAIHHGHQKGIIHRDLKPSNILVTSDPTAPPLANGGRYNAAPLDRGGHGGVVKIIDFGVARCTDSDLAVTTLQTDVGQLIGTLQYMSPEQCEGDPHDIDTRSDVYALGVVFYQLLCGKLPYDVTHMAMHQATRAIREQTPTKLSTLNHTLRGDVETIALKALEKERERRYQSAADFAHDIHRYLTGEAILAHRASIVYQLRLFARRNKAVFASLSALFVVLVAAVIVSTSLYLRAEAARRDAVEARNLAQRGFRGRYFWNQRTKEGVQKAIGCFEQAIQKDPSYALAYAALAESYVVVAGHQMGPPREALEKARGAATKALELDETVGEAHSVLGIIRGNVDLDWTGAIREFQRAIELNPGHATAHQWFAENLMATGRLDESFAELRQAQEIDPLSLPVKAATAAMNYFARRYDEAIELCERALDMDPNFTFPREFLARAFVQKGMFEQALENLRAAPASSEGDPRLVGILGVALAAAGRTEEARAALSRLQELSARRYVSPYYVAIAHTALDEKEQAFEWLYRACDERVVDLRFLKLDPTLDILRSDLRFDELLHRTNLAP